MLLYKWLLVNILLVVINVIISMAIGEYSIGWLLMLLY
jgi:hypothetical protein